MATKKIDKQALQKEKIEETVSKTEQFYNENKKTIWGCILAAVVIALGVLAYNQFYLKPKVAEAQEQAYPAEAAFRDGNFELALNGDGNNYGFAQVIDEYGNKAGKAMPLYAGICALQLQDYEAAVDYLKKYKGKEPLMAARAQACLGDAYVGLQKYEEAAAQFEKAAALSDNMYAAGYLLKAAVAYEELGNKDKALKLYETIKDKYPQSMEAYEIDKYINRIKFAE
ncbi:MAG: tetratricopeptide repeat protein [Bacteroidales bacterium]|nr:tetratricopeptide repeat protein [Bacteroidales bacterium]